MILWQIVGALWLMLSVTVVAAQEQRWETNTDAGMQAFNEGRYAEAGRLAERSVAMTEQVAGPESADLVQPLGILAVVAVPLATVMLIPLPRTPVG